MLQTLLVFGAGSILISCTRRCSNGATIAARLSLMAAVTLGRGGAYPNGGSTLCACSDLQSTCLRRHGDMFPDCRCSPSVLSLEPPASGAGLFLYLRNAITSVAFRPRRRPAFVAARPDHSCQFTAEGVQSGRALTVTLHPESDRRVQRTGDRNTSRCGDKSPRRVAVRPDDVGRIPMSFGAGSCRTLMASIS